MSDLHTLAAAVMLERTTEVTFFDLIEEYGDVLSADELDEVANLIETAKVLVKWEDACG